jgi:UDP-N-acetylmuramoyl-tripeptide--D-alanyl-D-alanine ligase
VQQLLGMLDGYATKASSITPKGSYIMQLSFVNRFFKPIKRCLKFELAKRYRTVLGMLGNVCFIGVTGSCGKTTTTELIATILAKEGHVRKGSHENTTPYIAKTILTVYPWHRFCVNEVSAASPGAMEKSAKLLQPQIGVVTHIGQDHYSNYRKLELTSAEKGKLVEALPVGGVAVLNADDPYVYDMRRRTKAQVITYGLSADAMVHGENVSCIWPKPMSLDVCYAEKWLHIQTHLLGKHWAYAVLAALSAGIAVGISLERAVQAVKTFYPMLYRMSPHETPGGVTFICDNWKASLWTIPASLDFMRTAKAERKVVVIGSISDTPKSFYDRYRAVIRQALDAVEKIIFVGEHARSALRARPHPEDDHIMAFDTLYQLNSFLSNYLKAGDLVLLKGTENADHLQRIVLSRTNDIACWREKCGKFRFCSDCRLQHSPFVPTDQVQVS